MNPKQLSLKNVMHNLHIIETADGYELHNAAGTAKYDLWGVRHEVNGIPEYFPTTISLRTRAPAPKEKSYSSGIPMAIEAPQTVTNTYNISLGVRKDKPVQNKVTISADKFEVKPGIDANIESLLENALNNYAVCAVKDVAKKVADDQRAMDELTSTIRETIRNECRPGGAIWGIRRRGI
ncbi:hypothetical protein [Citrobacter koseri]|uniref:hypothetical protein n=1 Tax=Citrobacter koseri TaxID=545 RepID=UPI0023AEB0DD|nr:hypothetical protein [Citrobacter koseri]